MPDIEHVPRFSIFLRPDSTFGMKLADYLQNCLYRAQSWRKRVKRCEACGSSDLWVETKVVCRAYTYENSDTVEPLNVQDGVTILFGAKQTLRGQRL